MARKTLTDRTVAALKPKAKAYTVPDPGCVGHYVRVLPSGNKSFTVVTRDPSGKQKWVTLGNATHLDIEDARKRAREIITAIKEGRDTAGPREFRSGLRRMVQAACREESSARRRSADISRATFYRSGVVETFGVIRRGDVTKMLDEIEDKSGTSSADHALAHLSGLFSWYALRHENYDSPIVRGMRRASPGLASAS